MHKLKKEIMCLKIQINSSYGVSGGSSQLTTHVYSDIFKLRSKIKTIKKRKEKIKRIFDGR